MTDSNKRRLRRLREIAALAPPPPGTDPVSGNMAILAKEEQDKSIRLPTPYRKNIPLDRSNRPLQRLSLPFKRLYLNRGELWTPINERGDMGPLTAVLGQHLVNGSFEIRELQDHTLRIAAKKTGNDAQDYLRIWFGFQRATAMLKNMESHIHHSTRALSGSIEALDQRIRALWPNLTTIAAKELAKLTPTVRFSVVLDDTDHELVTHWQPLGTDDANRNRLESARMGEKAAAKYYQGLGRMVEDTSIRQLDGSGDTDWVTHDLNVDGQPLDVKNNRSADSDRFGEHLWPRHKKTRLEHEDVDIVGVVATGDHQTKESIVLGQVGDSAISQLRRYVNELAQSSGLRIKIDEQSDWRERIPGWMFEYPDYHYALMPDWKRIHTQAAKIAPKLGYAVQPWMVGLSLARTTVATSTHITSGSFATAISVFLDKSLLSLRSLFWFVLIHMLSYRQRSLEERCSMKQGVEEHLFIPGAKNFPLGLYDPREYIWNLVQTIGKLLRSNHEILNEATNFQLVGLNILRARISRSEWQTILAYCGICGQWPLDIASCRVCPCFRKRLVCNDCRCNHCGYWYCEGATYESTKEAQAVAKTLPGWRQSRNTLKPPSEPGSSDFPLHEYPHY